MMTKRKVGRPVKNLALTIEAIEWRFANQKPWRAIPARFGHWNSIYRYWARHRSFETRRKAA